MCASSWQPQSGEALSWGLLGYFFCVWISASNLFGLIRLAPLVPVPLKSDVTHQPDPSIEDKPSIIGIKPIKEKESWLNAKKITLPGSFSAAAEPDLYDSEDD